MSAWSAIMRNGEGDGGLSGSGNPADLARFRKGGVGSKLNPGRGPHKTFRDEKLGPYRKQYF